MMSKHRVEHGAKYDDTDDDAYPQTHLVNLLDAHTHFRDARAHIEL